MTIVLMMDESVKRYGRVVVGENSLVDANVILGHPGASAVNAAQPLRDTYASLDAFYSDIADEETRIGRNAIVRSGTVVYSGVVVGERFDCGHNVIIREGVEIGDGVYVKNNTEIMTGAMIGDGCRVAGVVADEVVLGARVSSFGVLTHAYPDYISPAIGRKSVTARATPLDAPTVEDDVIIGRGAMVIGRRRIGRGARIDANAVVTFDVPAGGHVRGPRPTTDW